jgi:hypothetical protein
VPTDEEYEASLRAAETALKQAQSAEEVRATWKAHVGTLGHRTLGRLLMGQAGDRILDRRAERTSSE